MNFKLLLSAVIGIVAVTAIYSIERDAHVIQSNQFDPINNVSAIDPIITSASEPTTKSIKDSVNNKPISPQALLPLQESAIERFRNQAEASDLKQAIVKEHDTFKRYPSENRAFESEEQDPVKQKYDVDERTTLSEDHSMGLTIWSDEKYYLLNDTVNVYAFIQDAEGQKQSTSFLTSVFYDESQSLGELKLEDQNGDGIYQGSLELNQENTLGKGPGIYKIRIQDIKNKLTDSVTFTLSQPDIALTGNYKEHIDSDGNLIIDAEVSIGATNNFYIQASLYSSTNVAIGVTQFSQQLSSGNHWIPLSFSGLMIQDAQEAGPYVLKKVSVAKVTMPMQRAPLEEPDFQTDSYALSEFSQ